MKRTTLLTWLLVTVSTASLTACGWTSRTKAEAWLEELPLASAQVDTSGKWIELSGGLTPYVDPYTDSGYSYGPSRMLISQRGNRLFGTFRDFEIIGAVDRDKVYVVAIAEGVAYYSMHLQYDDKTAALFGRICDGFHETADGHCRGITLEK